MASMQARLSKAGLWSSVLKSAAVQALLDSIQIEAPEPAEADREAGKAKFGIVENALGVFDLNLVAPGDPRDYVLDFTGPAGARTGFRLAVSLNEGPQKPLFTLLQKLPGHALKAAVRKTSPDGEWLEEVPGGKVELSCDTLWLVLRGSAGGSVDVLLSPNSDPPDGVVVLALQPSTVLLGGTGFGLEIPSGIAFDDADDAVPPGRTVVDGVTLDPPADKPAWRGIAVRTARFYLPKGVPFLGGHAVEAHLQIGRSPTPGIDLLVLAKVPPKNERPGIDVRIECRDPTASGLDGFVPTLVEAVMELPIAGRTEPGAPGGALTFGGGKPVKVRARYLRTPSAAGVAPARHCTRC